MRPERAAAADEVCYALLIMMALGGLDIDMGWRRFLAEPMARWENEAVLDGDLKEAEEEEDDD